MLSWLSYFEVDTNTDPCLRLYRMSDASGDEEDSGELTHLPHIGTAPIPEVEAVLRTADHWHFDAFRLTEVSQGYPLSTLGFWLIQQNRVAKEFSELLCPSLHLNSACL